MPCFRNRERDQAAQRAEWEALAIKQQALAGTQAPAAPPAVSSDVVTAELAAFRDQCASGGALQPGTGMPCMHPLCKRSSGVPQQVSHGPKGCMLTCDAFMGQRASDVSPDPAYPFPACIYITAFQHQPSY